MLDYVNLLLDAINKYNEDDVDSKNRLRDLVCIISENDSVKSDPLIKELLYTASHKMRIFGYNVQNGFYKQENINEKHISELQALYNQSIVNMYRSKVRNNNILDKSQKSIIDFYQSLDIKRMLISAPTSYGKTFIMREILYLNQEKYKNILLVFPTVALLRENALNMEELNQDKKMGYNVIKSIDREIDCQDRNIFVLTPERAMQLLAQYPNIEIDFFFYDEMYKIDEDYCNDETDDNDEKKNSYAERTFLDEARAKTFRICLYLLSKRVKDYYLAGPNLKREKFGKGMQRYIAENNIQVKEIEFEPTKRIMVKAYNKVIDEDYTNLPYIEKPGIVKIHSKVNDRICDVVNYIEQKGYGATILYCTTPAKANEYATKLAENHQGNVVKNERFSEFIEHLKRNYNIDGSINEWSFVNVLEMGFGMHHGKMPKYIQKEILDLFNEGIFNLLFCTSTIVEGVNTNAKNMVVLNHSKGTKELTVFDFKNIIGRAGRYYHNFVGRYFLVDKELEKFEHTEDLTLNFVTYDDQELDPVDIDNSEYMDLSDINKNLKHKREEQFKEYLLTNDIYEKNRLIKREYQEILLRFLLDNNILYNKFYRYLSYPDILMQFTTYHAMNTVLDIFEKSGLLDATIVRRYKAVSNTYCNEGFHGLLRYEIDNARGDKVKHKRIDKAYMDAFKTQKDIIEHKIPKILALFETIFSYASLLRRKTLDNFSLSKVSRFYETGVKSYIGEQLIEFGFPVDAIKRIEDNNLRLLSMDASASQKYILEHLEDIKQLLDSYERGLLDKALKSICS
ncbi:helicase-related protein [Clostridium sp. MCC328]|uniref:helicase-related protein n=1 Tax=Clostridium sp. MCC328 TaxID=2592642 RepID=UPI001C03534B|nr:helicase-related protein [Clostridium sp. MCC328]